MDILFKKYKKVILLLTVVFSIVAVASTFYYLSVPEKTIEQIDGDNRYAEHQYLTDSETKEREKIEKDFAQKAKEVGSDVEKQKEITDEYKGKVNNFNKVIFTRNEERFKKYIEKLNSYFKQHPEMKKGEMFSEYAYLNSNVELKLFSQAANNLKTISKKLNFDILEV